MRIIETLMDEHREIERVLAALEVYADKVVTGELPPLEDLADFCTLLREFADRCHHGKEEDILFAEMERHGFTKDTGPLAVMYQEHEHGRRLVRALITASQQSEWTPDLRKAVVKHAREFVSLLRAHIQKEDHVLYPMSEKTIPQSRMDELAVQSDEFEQKVMKAGTHEKLHAQIHEIAEKYGNRA